MAIFNSYVKLPEGISIDHIQCPNIVTHWFSWDNYDVHTMDGEEILHQLIGGKHPTIYRVSTILLVVQDFATIHSRFQVGLPDPFRASATHKILQGI